MSLPTLDPEIADLGLAIGLLSAGSGGGVELDSDWLKDPGPRITTALADEGRRAALIRFVDEVLGQGEHLERDGVVLLPLFDLRALANDDSLPDLTVQASLDARPANHVEVGVAVSLRVEQPRVTTELLVPLYRAKKTGRSVSQEFALLDGGVVQVSTELTLSPDPVPVAEFGLAGVAVSLATPLVGGPPPAFRLRLIGLHLPGAATTEDIDLGGPGASIEDSLLSMVLGLVRQSAAALSGPAADELAALLDLLGLGDAAAIPALPVQDVLARGAEALRDWFTEVMSDVAARAGWTASLAQLLGGTVSGDLVDIALGSGGVTAQLGLRSATGPGGYPQVTPRVGLSFTTVAGDVRLGGQVMADLFQLDVGTGSMTPLPYVDVAVTATGSGTGAAAKLLGTGPLDVGAVRLGLAIRSGSPQLLVELDDVTVDGVTRAVLDLSSPQAVVAAAGELAADLVTAALDALGDAGAHLSALLGLTPPAGVPALDGAALLGDPLGTLTGWWQSLATTHRAAVPEVIAHLRDLLANDTQVLLPIRGTGTQGDPWLVPVVSRLAIECWIDGDRLVVAPAISLRVDDLAGGCTVVLTTIRVELVSVDLADGSADFLGAVAVEARLRARGGTEARLALGAVSVVADHIGLRAGWATASGLGVELLTPGLAVESAEGRVPLVLPRIDASGSLIVPTDAWHSVEMLLGVLAANAPFGWLSEVVAAFGWSVTGESAGPHLPLADLAADPVLALTTWLSGLVRDGDVVGSLTASLARVLAGSSSGLAGSFSGCGTPNDPWLAGLGSAADGPALAVWLGPSGPVLAPSLTTGALRSWRPGSPGLPPVGLAQALFDEAPAGPEIAALAAGRSGIAQGLAALAGRWEGTDGLVAPPPVAVPGVSTVQLPELDASRLPSIDLASLLPALPAGAVVVRVVVATSAADLPWTAAPGRLLDLTVPGLSPASFSAPGAAAGEWVVALAPRAAASLGGTTDPSGVVGQAARLRQVLEQLATAGPVVLVALGGAGNAARLAADAVAGVTHLVTLGTPWSPATFDTARTGVPGDALRLLRALLPAPDPADSDDPDLALGRALVTGFLRAARGAPEITELEAPRPTVAVRTGLTAVAVFGELTRAQVGRAMTAIFAAGLSARARARAAAALLEPTSACVGLRLPFALATPPGGHGTIVSGALLLSLATVDAATSTVAATPAITLELDVADSDAWLLGGPGTTPVGGSPPAELRRLSARVSVGLYGGSSTAELVLHEGAALGGEWERLVVRPPAVVTGTLELEPLLPEAQALLSALCTRLAATTTTTAAADGSPAAALLALLKAAGVSQPDGALLPDGLAHLLHDAGGQLRAVLAGPALRSGLLQALAGLLPFLAATPDGASVDLGPLTVEVDVATRTVDVTATGSTGLLRWRLAAGFSSAGTPSFDVGLGDRATDAFALTAIGSPLQVQLVRSGGAPDVPLWPSFDVAGLGRLAAAAVPAEALRVVLEGLRPIDTQLGTALEGLCSALGMLRPDDGTGFRAVVAPLGLFEDPAAWFAQAGVLSAVTGGPLDLERVVDLLEAVKPFVGLAGTPRGVLPVAPGVQVLVAATAQGPSLAVDVDPSSWLGAAGRPPFTAGLRAGLTIPASGPPLPTVALFVGVPDGPGGTTTPQHRRAVHLTVEATGLRLFLRPSNGPDLEIFPTPAGFGSLLGAGVTELLPLALDELASMDGDSVRTEIASLVGSLGRGLGIAAGSPATFSSSAISALAAVGPEAHLRAHLPSLVAEVVGALDAVLRRVLAVAVPVAVVSGSGVLTVTVRTVVLRVASAPFAVSLEGSVSGLPVLGSVTVSMSVDGTGLSAWSAGLGPAQVDLGGPVLRPFLRGGLDATAGTVVELGLGLDGLAPTAVGHRELTARWREAAGAVTVLVTERTATSVAEDLSDEGVAVAAIGAVLDLVGGWVLGVPEVRAQLAKQVGPTATTTVRTVLLGSVLDPAAPAGSPQLMPQVLDGWPGKLLTLASRLASAAPTVAVGDLTFGISNTAGVLGVSMSTTNAAGLDLPTGGDLSLRLVVDASWIDPPAGPVSPGIVLSLLRVAGTTITPAPGIAVNGVGLRLGKVSGPLIDAGLRLDSLAVHLFGSVALSASQEAVFAGGVQVELGGLAVPLGSAGGDNPIAQGVLEDAGGSGAPPRPAFSPALAVQEHGQGVAITLRAGSGDGPWFLPIQRAFGPVYLDQVGLGVSYRGGITPRQLETISLYLDAQVSLMGLSAAVDKLRLTYHVDRPFFDSSAWEVDLDGFAIASSIGGLSLAGGLRKFALQAPLSGVEYLGMLKVGFGAYGLDLYGGYANPTTPAGTSFASFFAFGVLHAPIGGPPAFFITGIGVGFGINRELRPPDIATLNSHPFMLALRASGPAPEPMKQLSDMRSLVPPAQGTYWVAAGISFTSFVLITGELLVTVQFGDGLEIAILGLARAQLPTAALTLVSVELALLARFSTREGVLIVQAQLTENSWLLHESVRLTGGFAFATWWKGPNAGQFVVTVGGYHPRFHHDGYPVVPRVGLRWSPVSNISIVGEVYFALCSEALMAGVHIEVAAHFGPARARLAIGGDAIVFFDPFWFSVRVFAMLDVSIKVWLLFGSVTLELSFGVDVEVTGPPIFCKGHFSVYGFRVPFEFGDQADPSERALDAPAFAEKYLRGGADAQVVQASVVRGGLVAGKSASGGVAKPPDGSAANPFRVVPEFVLTLVTTAPNESVVLAKAGSPSTTVAVPVAGLGVAPMYSATLDATLTLTVASLDGQAFGLVGIALAPRAPAAFPAGVWGPAPNPKAPVVPAGETVDACDGMTVDTTLSGALFQGAPPIDYHQVKLPLGGRKPLPFVTDRARIDARVTAATRLKAAAAVLTAGNPDSAERFLRAAVMLSAAGQGASTVSALRGDRSAPPSFGSLADDLADAPVPESPTVTAVPVDRGKPAGPRFAPVVKALLGAPLTYAVPRSGGTSVRDPGKALRRTPPTLASVRAATTGRTQLSLSLLPHAAAGVERTVVAAGAVPLTRLATSPLAAVANARPAPQAAARIARLSNSLVGSEVDRRRGAPAVLHDGELAIVTVASRPRGDSLDTVVVVGAATRVLCLAAGGRVVEDRVVPEGRERTPVELPRTTERVVLVGIGDQAGAGGTVPGWCAGQQLPAVGWGAALAAGATVTGHGNRTADHRERGDGGWISTTELATAAEVVTVFTDPVQTVAVVVDDAVGGDAAGSLAMRLLDATRVLVASGEPRPPELLVDGVRSILLFAVATTGPAPAVVVDGCGGGQLAGVLGSSGSVSELAELLADLGAEAAVGQPLVGGPGRRAVSYVMADGPVDKAVPRSQRPAKKAPARKAPAKKATVRKAPASKAPVKKALVKKAPAKKAAGGAAAPAPRKRQT